LYPDRPWRAGLGRPLPARRPASCPASAATLARRRSKSLRKEKMMKVEPQKEHHWLQKLVGDWTFETECIMGPDQPPEKFAGSERVRSLGGVWVLCEGRGETPGGGTGLTLMTLGYDPVKKRFVGSFIGSMMTHLWIYDGALDPAAKILTLDTEGPS